MPTFQRYDPVSQREAHLTMTGRLIPGGRQGRAPGTSEPPDGWRVPGLSVPLTPNEKDDVRALAARRGQSMAAMARDLLLAAVHRAAQHPPGVVEINEATGTARVSSRSTPGVWHTIDDGGNCDCPAARHGLTCSHVKALREHVQGGLDTTAAR